MANLDFEAIGKTIQQQYPQYSSVPSGVIGEAYVKKFYPGEYQLGQTTQTANIQAQKELSVASSKRALDYSPEAIQQEVAKKTALSQADTKIKLDAAQAGKEADRKKALTMTGDTAQKLLDVINAGRKGTLKGQAYKDALNGASSAMAASIGFGQGGKALTGPELSILGGQIPVIKQQGQNILDKITGNIPAQKGIVVDNEATLERKAKLALATAKGQKIDFSKLPQEDTNNGNILQNAGQDVKGLLNGILNLPSQVAGNARQVGQEYLQTGNPQPVLNAVNPNMMILNMLKGYAGNLNKDLGQPMQGGDIVGRATQNFQQHPVSTILDVLPFLQASKVGLAGRVGEAGNVAKTGEAGLLNKAGSELRGQVRQIDVGPMVGGPQKEAIINQTLNELNIKGSPQQQYTQLQPVMSKLEDTIHQNLNANPKTVTKDQIRDDIIRNLKQELPERTVTDTQAKKAINTYLGDIYGQSLGETISTKDLFAKKQAINSSYQRIQKKINMGASLTPKEEVTVVVRKAIDDIIAEKHPAVKEMTLQQSRLFDAADSLYKQRSNQMRVRIPGIGNYLPMPAKVVRGGADALGRILQGR